MSDSETGQVVASAAEIYDRFFVPALFANWVGPVCEAAGIAAGQRVLDVACGTGVLADGVSRRVGETGHVTGIDLNPGMLAQALRRNPSVDWRESAAEDLPFDDGQFDAVISQFGLMFFEDRTRALAEMWRVLKPGGKLAVAVWASLDQTPGYSAMRDLLDRQFGGEAAASLDVPYSIGESTALEALFEQARVDSVDIVRRNDTARFPSIDEWVHTDIRGWTLAHSIDDAQYSQLLSAAQSELTEFCRGDGSVQFAHPGLIATAVKV